RVRAIGDAGDIGRGRCDGQPVLVPDFRREQGRRRRFRVGGTSEPSSALCRPHAGGRLRAGSTGEEPQLASVAPHNLPASRRPLSSVGSHCRARRARRGAPASARVQAERGAQPGAPEV
ncbi:unnamed protein product, partial [Ectocarpus fasciculatus]